MIRGIYNKIKWFIQRGKRGWSDCDVWNTDMYLSRIISEMVRELKKSNGIPCGSTRKKWNKVLEDIEGRFNILYAITVGDIVISNKASKEIYEKVRKDAFRLLSKHFYDLLD